MSPREPIRVLLHHRPDAAVLPLLETLPPDVELTVCPPEETAVFRHTVATTDVIWHVLTPLGADEIRSAKQLRLIQKIGVGVNTIDLAAARDRGIAVCNMPGTNTQAVAEMTLLHILSGLRQATSVDRAMRKNCGWEKAQELSASAGEICGRTVGFLGYGAVPQRLTPVLQSLGARMIAWTRRPLRTSAVRRVEFGELLSIADIISIHLPLTEETRGLIDGCAIARMKTGAILVNTARGEIVSEGDLAQALQSEKLAFAGLDTFADESAGPDQRLRRAQNTLMSPHVAWRTRETWERSLSVALQNVCRLRSGQPLLQRVV
jgi:phosphoglycerate dehydrogenase-like enzyme